MKTKKKKRGLKIVDNFSYRNDTKKTSQKKIIKR